MVETNNKTIKLPLLITIATASPLMRLGWMKRLGIHLNADNSEIKTHDVKLDDTGKKTDQLKNEFKDLFYNNKEINDLSVKINLKEVVAQLIHQKGRPIPMHIQEQVAKVLEPLIENGYLKERPKEPKTAL